MAGSPMTNKKERVTTVRLQEDEIHKLLQPVAEGVDGDLEVEDRKHEEKALAGGNEEKVEELDSKYQQLKTKVEEYFDDQNGEQYRTPPMIKSPQQPTKEEYEKHQTTHTHLMPHGANTAWPRGPSDVNTYQRAEG